MRDAAVRAAEDVLMEHALIRMSPDGFEAFLSVVLASPTVVPEMVDLAGRPAPWEAGRAAAKT